MANPDTMTSLAKRPRSAADMALMPPPSAPPPKRIKRPSKVLDEDTYESTLSHIIARDFFPGLLEVEAQEEYMSALDSQDKAWIAQAGRKLEVAMSPVTRRRRGVSAMRTPVYSQTQSVASTPRAHETLGFTPPRPADTPTTRSRKKELEKQRLEDEERKSMSLTDFQSKYTSEDNESFNALLDRQNDRKAKKYAWLQHNGNNLPSAQRIAQEKVRERRKLLGQDNADEERKIGLLNDSQERPALPDVAPCPPRNALMFIPDGLDKESVAADTKPARRAEAPKSVSFRNTRLPNPDTPDTRTSRASSPTTSAIHDAIGGRPRLSESEIGGDSAPNDTPRVNGYAFVDEEPTVRERALARARQWQITDREDTQAHETPNDEGAAIFGRLTAEAAAAENNGYQGKGAQFSIQESSQREALLHRMVERTAASKREASGSSPSTRNTPVSSSASGLRRKAAAPGTPRFMSAPRTPAILAAAAARQGAGGSTSTGGGDLTPAAKRLLDRVGASSTPVRSSAPERPTAADLWTPTGRTPRAKAKR